MSLPVLKRKHFFGDRRRRVMVHRVPKQAPILRHRHEFCEIVVILSGRGVHVTGEFRREIEAGDVLVVNRHRSHGYERTQSLNLVNILIHDEVLTRIGRQLREVPGYHALFNTRAVRWNSLDERVRLRLEAVERVQVEEWITRLETESRSDMPENGVIAEAYLTLIVGAVARRYSQGAGPVRPAQRVGVGDVVGWIEQNLGQPIKVAALARRAGMSERSFYRAFRETMGCAPVEYVLRARIQRAAEMLQERTGRRRVAEIANECGFADSNYFSACFRRFKGCAPREFAERV